MKKLTAVVLAAGVGKRFWPLSTNKVLFTFLGKPLVDFSVIDVLPKEVSDVVIVSNTENQDALSSISVSVPVLTVLQSRPLGMADALLSAREHLQNRSLLIIIADDITSPSLLSDVVKKGQDGNDFAVLPGWKAPAYFPGGYLQMQNNRVMGIVEKPDPANLPSEYVAISGHYIHDSNRFFEELSHAPADSDDAYEHAMTMLALTEKISMLPYEGGFSSLKYPWHVLDTLEVMFGRMKPKKGKNVSILSNVIIEGPVVIGDNVKIFENTKIVGPCYIGDNTIVGNNNIIRNSYIGKNCVTGFSTDITRSYVGDDCWFHSNYIGDSVLEGNVSMGSGAVLANLRLDDGEIFSNVNEFRVNTKRNKLGAMIGKHVRIGVNTSIMPGVKIGSNSFIGSGITVGRDVPVGSFVSQKDIPYTIVSNNQMVETMDRDEFKKHL